MMHKDQSFPLCEEPRNLPHGLQRSHHSTSPCEGALPPIDSIGLLAYLKRLDENIVLLLARFEPASLGLMTVKEAAQFLRISERTIRAQLSSKQWPGYRCGAAVRVDPLELKARMKRVPFGGKPSRSRPRSVSVNPSADLP